MIAGISRDKDGYYLSYFSYMNSARTYYTRHEFAETYQLSKYVPSPLMPFRHATYYENDTAIDFAPITYQKIDGNISIHSHYSLLAEDGKRVIAHVELGRVLDKNYFDKLSTDLNIRMGYSFDKPDFNYIHGLRDHHDIDGSHLHETNRYYEAATSIESLTSPIYFTVKLNKDVLADVLKDNRQSFLVLLFVVASIVMLLMRILLHRGLELPLSALMNQIDKLERQDYTGLEEVRTGDELQVISGNINQLAKAVQEREDSLKYSKENLEHLSNHDVLTGLPNRRFFFERLQHAVDLATRQNTRLAVMFLDLDQFKLVNDTLGHDVGDELLQQVSTRLLDNIRTMDTLARIGGDEFNVLIEDVGKAADVEAILHNIHGLFHKPFNCGLHEINVTVSTGIAMFPDDGQDTTTLIKYADLAMYKAKDSGRNRYSFFSEALSLELQERTDNMHALRQAIAGQYEQFSLVYQPKIPLQHNEAMSIEALLRWNRPGYGQVMPGQFISLAEETGQIIPMGYWALERACSDFMRLRSEGINLSHLSVNVSSVQLQQSDMVETVEHVLSVTGMQPAQLELEITENYIVTDEDEALTTLQSLRDIGIHLAIDDFGTGYSSMSYLQKLPITRIKIDKSFIDGLPDVKESVAIVKAIIGLAKTFNLSVTAEGIENAHQERFLVEEYCDESQGYLHSPPLYYDQLKDFYFQKTRP
jgi:diguanylate cyclase (GGDEF)-like protein